MKAEGNPLHETSPLVLPLEAVTRWVLRSPGVVVGGAVLLAVLAVLVTVSGLRFKTSRLDLLNPRSEYNQRWLAYLKEFGDGDDAVIVVRAEQPADLTGAIDDLAAELHRQPELFASIFARRDLAKLKSKALHFLPDAQLLQIEEQVQAAAALAPRAGQSADPAQALAQLNERLERVRISGPEASAAIEREYAEIAGRTLAGLNLPANPVGPSPQPSPRGRGGGELAAVAALENGLQQFEPQYLLADEGRLGFVLLKLKIDTGELARGSQAIGALRTTIAQVRERHPQAWIGLTGMPVIEFDEMQASQSDMLWTSLISFAAVGLLFVASYGGMRHAFLANIVLLIAMAWSFGVITLVVGHLNILSSAFACVLIGIGIDYGTYYVACYLRLRGEGRDEVEALVETARDVGPGMVTGGVTTAAAFFMTAMTDFVGVRELGLVAGYGIILCVVAAAVVLPPLVLLVDRQWPLARVPQILPAGGPLNLPLRRPKLVMLATLAVTVLAGAGLAYLRYDHNLLNLQPRHLESADIERQLLTQLEDSVLYAVSICDSPADLQARKAQFAALPSVAKTEDIASLLPAASPQKTTRIAAIREHLAALPGPMFAADVLRAGLTTAVATPSSQQGNQPQRLVQEIARAERLLAAQKPYETPATAQLAQLRRALASLPPDASQQRFAVVQAAAMQSAAPLAALQDLCDPSPPQLADLPQELVDRFVGQTQKHLLKVYARGDIWDMERLEQFVRDVEAIDPQVTGHPVQTFYASRHMQASYLWAGLYALGAVFVLLLFDFRHLGHALLAMLPLVIGVVQMCGVLGWLGLPLNPANMIALPLILGIGVDHGVHLVHEWSRTPGRFRLNDSTAVALLLIATTTTASFGALVLARHQGLQSLGQVLTIGVTTCLGASVLFFPALLAWLSRNNPEPATSAARETELAVAPQSVPREEQAEHEKPVLKLLLAIPEEDPDDEPVPCIELTEEDLDPAPYRALPVAIATTISARIDPPQEPPSLFPRRRSLPRRTDQSSPPPSSDRETPLSHLASTRRGKR